MSLRLRRGVSRPGHNVRAARMIWQRELSRFWRTRTRVAAGIVQPVGFLIVLGVGLAPIATDLPEGISYKSFLFPGILAMSAMMSGLYSTVSIVWDRQFGFLRAILAAPIARGTVIVGKLAGGVTVAVAQALLLIVLAPLAGVHLDLISVVELFGALLALSFGVTSLGLALSSRAQTTLSLQSVMTLVMQPLIFTSGAIFPIANLPTWLRVVCYVNPTTYAVDLVRRSVLGEAFALTIDGRVLPVGLDLAIILAFGAAMIFLSSRALRRAA